MLVWKSVFWCILNFELNLTIWQFECGKWKLTPVTCPHGLTAHGELFCPARRGLHELSVSDGDDDDNVVVGDSSCMAMATTSDGDGHDDSAALALGLSTGLSCNRLLWLSDSDSGVKITVGVSVIEIEESESESSVSCSPLLTSVILRFLAWPVTWPGLKFKLLGPGPRPAKTLL